MLLFTHSNTLVLWRKSPAPSAKNGATCYPEASDWNYVNNIKEREKRCVFCMTSIYVVAFNRPLLSFPVRRQKIQIFASSTQPQGEVSQLSTQARQKSQLSCWGSSAQKRWPLPQTYLEVGDKKEAGNDVRLLCDKRRAQRSQKFIMDDTRLASVRGGHSGNRHGG